MPPPTKPRRAVLDKIKPSDREPVAAFDSVAALPEGDVLRAEYVRLLNESSLEDKLRHDPGFIDPVLFHQACVVAFPKAKGALKTYYVRDEELKPIYSATQRSPLWYEARQKRLSASNWAAALGYCAYTTPQRQFEILTGQYTPTTNAWQQAHMDRGVVGEEKAVEKLLRDNPVISKIERPGLGFLDVPGDQTYMYCGSPDGIIHFRDSDMQPVLLEVKSVKERKPIPLAHRIQMTVLMAINELSAGWYVQYVESESEPAALDVTCIEFDRQAWCNCYFPRGALFMFQRVLPFLASPPPPERVDLSAFL